MTNEGSYLYVSGHDYNGDPLIQKFSTAGSTSSIYMSDFPGLGTAYDAAWISGGVWMARDNADSPVVAYDTSGMLVGFVDGATVSAAMGLTIDDEGYLWVSNPDDDTIYQLSVTTGITQGSVEPGVRQLSSTENPFSSSTIISGEGFNDATIDIFDLTGRRLEHAPFSGSFTWNAGGVPTGSYFALVRDDEGTTSLRLTRIN